jgi:hypothetical protein
MTTCWGSLMARSVTAASASRPRTRRSGSPREGDRLWPESKAPRCCSDRLGLLLERLELERGRGLGGALSTSDPIAFDERSDFDERPDRGPRVRQLWLERPLARTSAFPITQFDDADFLSGSHLDEPDDRSYDRSDNDNDTDDVGDAAFHTEVLCNPWARFERLRSRITSPFRGKSRRSRSGGTHSERSWAPFRARGPFTRRNFREVWVSCVCPCRCAP